VRRNSPVSAWLMVAAVAPVFALDWTGPGTVLLHGHDHEGLHLHTLEDGMTLADHQDQDPAPRFSEAEDNSLILQLPDTTRGISAKKSQISSHVTPARPVALQIPAIRNPQQGPNFAALRETLARIHGPPHDLLRSATLLLI
jgi:hypothetical protein